MRRSLLVVADSDSYVKWGASLASQLPADPWSVELVVLATPVLPSARQLRNALAGTLFSPDSVHTVELDELPDLIAVRRPDAVLLSLRGPLVRVVVPLVAAGPDRPVLLSGFPGLTIPAEPKAIVYREQVDLIVLHSRREVREFTGNATLLDVPVALGLATLPFLRTHTSAMAAVGVGVGVDSGVTVDSSAQERTDLVFAAQAKVPATREERIQLLGWLAAAARRRPARRVIVKVRARAGEAQTHAEAFDFAELLADPAVRDELGGTLPPNLVVLDGPMHDHVERAAALVTVSSTAVLEAIASGVPALLVDEFGVGPKLINTVFEGSGLFAGADEVIAGAGRHPDPAWLADNYFHGREHDDWARRLDELVAGRAERPLPLRARRHNLQGGALRRAFERKRMLGGYDRSPAGYLSVVVAVPSRWVVRRMRRIRRLFTDESA
ncbi:hypothetical protein J7E25_03735 [Agromyces sp. ISL-38]|uniref:DUF6716 putative glycosyltransferase n=1 Tax=Agromyces sp. ISL-38 TaxID=2819107 RepID=UPI001BE8FFE6|nr:DUF6716 putative glycosyltransferase [Agromyces sp. ISL-38]MBT2498196.1 hypothetical protein [Agromyces sp. ISL-38]